MSNNRFLQSKEQHKSNRFNFLDSEEPNKNLHNKDKDKNNSFTKPSSKDNSAYNNERYSERNPKKYPPRNSNNQFREAKIAPIIEFTVSDELFPLLNHTVTPSKNTSTNFKDALNHQTEIGITENITLRPGWVQISKIDNNIVIDQANIGAYDIKMQKIQELQEDPNYIMKRVVAIMQKKWIKYRIDYDNIYGEGAYNELHYLSPVYGSEYDTDDNESLSDSNGSDDY